MTTGSGLWCQQRILVTVHGPETNISQSFAQPYVRIGSDPAADLVLPAGDHAPPRSAYFHATDAGIYVVDLREDAETRFGGWLAENDEIPIGSYRLSARLEDSSGVLNSDERDLQAKQDALRVYPKLRVVLNGQMVANVRIRRRLTVIGHSRPSTLRIINKHISACHCVLYWDGNDVWIVDLLSSNRSRIDDRVVHAAHLPVGSRLGLHRITLEYIGLSDIESDPLIANTSDDSDVKLRAAAFGSDPAEITGERNLSDVDLDDGLRCPREKDELRRVLSDQQLELRTLHETLRDERERFKTVMSDRERELEAAAAAVQGAVRSLESQRRYFDEQNRRQSDEADGKQLHIEQRIQKLNLKLTRQEELLSRWEERMEKRLADVESTFRSLGQQRSVWEQNRDLKMPKHPDFSPRPDGRHASALGENDTSMSATKDTEFASSPPGSPQGNGEGLVAGEYDAPDAESESKVPPLLPTLATPDKDRVAAGHWHLPVEVDGARLLADKLSYEVCDRLVRRERSAVRRIRLMAVGFLAVVAAAGTAGVYLYRWLH